MTLQMNYQKKYEQRYDEEDRGKAISVATRMIENGDLLIEKIALYWGRTLE